jgi:flagellar basal-body rod protein FlgG
MSDIFSIGLSGLQASRLRSLNAANNLSNLNTPGYKAKRVDSVSLSGNSGTAVAGSTQDSTQGPMMPTGNPLDLAIQGEGFFQVTDAQGNSFYTRDGSFSRDSNGQFVNSQGFQLDPAIQVPENAENVSVGSDGTVTATVDGESVEIGTVQLATFSNPDGLSNEGGNLLSQTGASGIPQLGDPGTDGRGIIQSGFVEGSNVDIAREAIALISEENVFKANAAVIKTGDEMQREAIDLIG